MFYVVGDCYIKDIGSVGQSPDNIIFKGYPGIGVQQRKYFEAILAECIDQSNTNKAVNQNIIRWFGHVDIRDTVCNENDVLELTDYYISTSIRILGGTFKKIYFAEPFAMYSDSKRKSTLEFEIIFLESLKKSAKKYNVDILFSQKDIYKAIGKDGILRSEAVREENNIGWMWPKEYQKNILDLILKKVLTL